MGRVRCVINSDNTVSEIHRVVVHRFQLSDVDDPDLYAAQPMWEWQNSEAGKFVIQNAVVQPEWHKNVSYLTMGYQYAIIAELEKKKLAEFYLKFGKPNA